MILRKSYTIRSQDHSGLRYSCGSQIISAGALAGQYQSDCVTGLEHRWDDTATLCGTQEAASISSHIDQEAMIFMVVRLSWDHERLFLIPQTALMLEDNAQLLCQIKPWVPAPKRTESLRAPIIRRSRSTDSDMFSCEPKNGWIKSPATGVDRKISALVDLVCKTAKGVKTRIIRSKAES